MSKFILLTIFLLGLFFYTSRFIEVYACNGNEEYYCAGNNPIVCGCYPSGSSGCPENYWACTYGCCGPTGDTVSACFLPGTQVQGREGAKKIEDIKVGDTVTSFVGDKITESKVSQIFERKRDFYYELEADGEGDHKGRRYSVKASAEHPFYIGNNEYKEISKLVPGDTIYILIDKSLIPKKVTSNTRIDKQLLYII